MTREAPAPASGPSVLFVNQHYYPDVASTGQHLTDLAEHLASRGYSVAVLTARGRYLSGQLDAPPNEVRNGVRITRVRATSFGRGSVLGRLLDYATFYLSVLLRIVRGAGGYDGVIFLSTPPLLAFIGSLTKRLRGVRYAVWAMDLHPDAEIAAGMLRPRSPLTWLLNLADRAGFRGADFVVDLGPYMRRRIAAKGVSAQCAHTVPVWSAADEVLPVAKGDNPLVRELGLEDRFVVMYSGNAGIVHDFDDILEAMRLLEGDPRIAFLFVGGGPQRQRIERYAAEHGLTAFRYLDYFPRDQLRWSLAVGDAHLISLRREFVGISVPGKLYGIMAAGRPTMFVGPSRCETADTIREARCGEVIDPEPGGAAERLAAALRAWSASPATCARLGAAGRSAFLARFEREVACTAFERVVAQHWAKAAPAAAIESDESARGDARRPARVLR